MNENHIQTFFHTNCTHRVLFFVLESPLSDDLLAQRKLNSLAQLYNLCAVWHIRLHISFNIHCWAP